MINPSLYSLPSGKSRHKSFVKWRNSFASSWYFHCCRLAPLHAMILTFFAPFTSFSGASKQIESSVITNPSLVITNISTVRCSFAKHSFNFATPMGWFDNLPRGLIKHRLISKFRILPKNRSWSGKKCCGHTLRRYHAKDLHFNSRRSAVRFDTSMEFFTLAASSLNMK